MLVGCGSDRIGTAADPLDAVLRLQLDTCESLARERATAVVSSDLQRPDTPPGVAVAATVAHPFLDDDGKVRVETLRVFDRRGDELEAQVVMLDPERDLALLHIDRSTAHDSIQGLEMRGWVDSDTVAMGGFTSSDSPAVLAPVVVERRVEVSLDGAGPRMGLEVLGTIEPGDSGAPLIARDPITGNGIVVGIMFAAEREGDGGWAVDASAFVALTGERIPIELGCPTP